MSLFDKAINRAGQSVLKSYSKPNSFQKKQLKKVWDKAGTEYNVPMPTDVDKAEDWSKDKESFQQGGLVGPVQVQAIATELQNLLTKLSRRMSQQQVKPQPYQPPTLSTNINPFLNTRKTLQLPGQTQTKLPQLQSATVPF